LEKRKVGNFLARSWDSWEISDTRKIFLKGNNIKILAKIHHILYETFLWE
jgi:hypothetical protein